jgi:hypothetical protein
MTTEDDNSDEILCRVVMFALFLLAEIKNKIKPEAVLTKSVTGLGGLHTPCPLPPMDRCSASQITSNLLNMLLYCCY